MKLQLPSVTLMIVDCLNAERAIEVIEHCKSKVDFGAVKILTDIPNTSEHWVKIKPLNSLVAYSIFMLTKCHEYIETDHVLIVQRDGFILNPESFNPAWLEYDYIAPLFVQVDIVGSGGFSMRSRKLMQHVSTLVPEWDWTQSEADRIQSIMGYYEDGVICLSGQDYKFAPMNEAAQFAQGGNRNPLYFKPYPFGFHRTWQAVDFKTGLVDSSDTSKTLCSGYDNEPL